MDFWVMTPCKLVGTGVSKEQAGSIFYPRFESKILFPKVFINQNSGDVMNKVKKVPND
jgi:hypothetical protein